MNYNSEGLKLKVNCNGTEKIIDHGWIEYIDNNNGNPQLHIIFAGQETIINLELEKVPMEYKIHYIDADTGLSINNDSILEIEGFSYLDEKAPEITGYTLVDQINQFTLNFINSDIYFLYKKNILFDSKSYVVDFKNTETVSVSNAKMEECKFESSDENIGYINSNGEIIPKSFGIATITVKDISGNEDTAIILVDDDIFNIDFLIKNYTISIDETAKLDLIINPEASSQKNKISFISDNPEIADVDRDGTITGYKAGKTIITAKYNDLETTTEVEVIANGIEIKHNNSNDDRTTEQVLTKDNTNIVIYNLLFIISFGLIVYNTMRKKKIIK